jgi:hypothetical protein
MTNQIGTPKGALIAIGDMLDYAAKVKPGQEVLILAEIESLYDKSVDQEAISWIQAGVQARGANATVLWIGEKQKAHAWHIPPVAKAAMGSCDLLINNSYNITAEELSELRALIREKKFRMTRNFASTSALLCTAWAQTPWELVSKIRYQVVLPFKEGAPFQLTDPNGTHLEGTCRDPEPKEGVPAGEPYTMSREDAGYGCPWPEWLHPPLRLKNTQGIFIFDCMHSWWARYIGISPYFSKPIQLTIQNNRITDIKGGEEADALSRFMAAMVKRVGNGVYDFEFLHTGVHPQASVGPHQCPNPLVRRVIEHSHTSNIHVHIGAPPSTYEYPYWVHITGDIRKPTFRVGDTLIHDQGHLTALDSPEVRAIEKKYPGRPGCDPAPRDF